MFDFFSFFQRIRTDLTSLKVYAIDVDEADEVSCSCLSSPFFGRELSI